MREEPIGLLGRMSANLLGRRFSHFFTELVLIVAGVLIALAIDGWAEDRREREAETEYLELLLRDVREIEKEAQLQLEFEHDKVLTAGAAYALLQGPNPAASGAEIGLAISSLTMRRTVNLGSATYEQMVSSGHLQLLRNRELRDQLVRHFADMRRSEMIFSKNNQDLIDDVIVPYVMNGGISFRARNSEIIATINRATDIQNEALGADFRPPLDTVLAQPPDAESWNDMRRQLLFRLNIAANGQARAEQALEQNRVMAAAIAAELDTR